MYDYDKIKNEVSSYGRRYCNFLDKKEEKLLKVLTKDYEKFIGPGSI